MEELDRVETICRRIENDNFNIYYEAALKALCKDTRNIMLTATWGVIIGSTRVATRDATFIAVWDAIIKAH